MTSCEKCTDYFEGIDLSKDIMLPYYREIVEVIPSPLPRANYKPYHLFCLKKNLTPFIYSIDPSYDINITSKQYKEVLVLVLRLYSAGTLVTPSEKLMSIIRNNILSFVDLYPFCLVYSSDMSDYPSEWFKHIFPRLGIGLYRINGIFVDLEDRDDFNNVWETMHQEIINKLADYYKRGVIYLSDNDPLIKDWNLKRLEDEDGLYEPEWEYNFTVDKIAFLLSKRKRLVIFLGENHPQATHRGWLLHNVRNYQEAARRMEELLDI